MEAAVQREMKKCPACAELILAEALKCRHCGEWLDELAAAGATAEPVVEEHRETSVLRTLTAYGIGALPGCWLYGSLLVASAMHAEGYGVSSRLFEVGLKGAGVGALTALFIAHLFGIPLGLMLRRARAERRPTGRMAWVFVGVTTVAFTWMACRSVAEVISPADLKNVTPFFWTAVITSLCSTAAGMRFGFRPDEPWPQNAN